MGFLTPYNFTAHSNLFLPDMQQGVIRQAFVTTNITNTILRYSPRSCNMSRGNGLRDPQKHNLYIFKLFPPMQHGMRQQYHSQSILRGHATLPRAVGFMIPINITYP
jgi:hypothetical protein